MLYCSYCNDNYHPVLQVGNLKPETDVDPRVLGCSSSGAELRCNRAAWLWPSQRSAVFIFSLFSHMIPGVGNSEFLPWLITGTRPHSLCVWTSRVMLAFGNGTCWLQTVPLLQIRLLFLRHVGRAAGGPVFKKSGSLREASGTHPETGTWR